MVAIACGGTGGHLFPGIAIGEELLRRGFDVMLLVSSKAVDQEAVREIANMEVVSLPSVALQNRNYFSFAKAAWRCYRQLRQIFKKRIPAAVVAMGGFTSAPPIWAGKHFGVPTFLHEANTIPGRANRLLARTVGRVWVHFPETADHLKSRHCEVVGMPVRRDFEGKEVAECRQQLGLNIDRPVLLVMGGSQGALAINELMIQSAKSLHSRMPNLQIVHFTGCQKGEAVVAAYAEAGITTFVRGFFDDVSAALTAASVVISRAGASSMAEIACLQVPSILIPFPFAADDHQQFNARAYEKTGAAHVLPQDEATPQTLVTTIVDLLENEESRAKCISGLRKWDNRSSAPRIADRICNAIQFSSVSGNRAGSARSEQCQLGTVFVGQ